MENLKTYLEPAHRRRGQPIIRFIAHDEDGYWLGAYYDLSHNKPYRFITNGFQTFKYKGYGYEYDAVSRTRISLFAYKALLKESKTNHKYK